MTFSLSRFITKTIITEKRQTRQTRQDKTRQRRQKRQTIQDVKLSPEQQKIAELVGRGRNTLKAIAYLGRGFTQIYTDLVSSALISVNLCQQLILVGY